MYDPVPHALKAFESALRHAPYGGLRDLHEGLVTGQLAIPYDGTADLVRGRWGSLGTDGGRAERYSACPLSALYVRWAREHHGGLGLAMFLVTRQMAKDGYKPVHFYGAWDRGKLSPGELSPRVMRHLKARLEPTKGALERGSHR